MKNKIIIKKYFNVTINDKCLQTTIALINNNKKTETTTKNSIIYILVTIKKIKTQTYHKKV